MSTYTPLRRGLSLCFGWLADRRIPTPLRSSVYRLWAAGTGSNLEEVQLPLKAFPSLGAFFVRRLREGARSFPDDPQCLPSPVDGAVQDFSSVCDASILQAKGRPYPLRELLGDSGSEIDFEGGYAWTIYLSPKDYHRIHTPVAARLTEATWIGGSRYSVAPRVLAARERVLSINERCVLRLESDRGPYFMVLVGALNVGRIRVVGVPPGHVGALEQPKELERGAELARFEMGSTIVMVWPPGGPRPAADLSQHQPLRMGQEIGRFESV